MKEKVEIWSFIVSLLIFLVAFSILIMLGMFAFLGYLSFLTAPVVL